MKKQFLNILSEVLYEFVSILFLKKTSCFKGCFLQQPNFTSETPLAEEFLEKRVNI